MRDKVKDTQSKINVSPFNRNASIDGVLLYSQPTTTSHTRSPRILPSKTGFDRVRDLSDPRIMISIPKLAHISRNKEFTYLFRFTTPKKERLFYYTSVHVVTDVFISTFPCPDVHALS